MSSRILTLLIFSLSCSACCLDTTDFIITSSELEIERLEKNRFPLEPLFSTSSENGETKALYTFESQDCLCVSEPTLCVSDSTVWSVSINGKPLRGSNGRYYFDGLIEDGENIIAMRGKGPLPEVSVVGQIMVQPTEYGSWRLSNQQALNLGSLALQGLPFYTGEVAYSRIYEVSRKQRRCPLLIKEWKGKTGSLYVNGEKVSDLGPSPYRINIGPHLVVGPNKVEIRISGEDDFGLYEDFTIE